MSTIFLTRAGRPLLSFCGYFGQRFAYATFANLTENFVLYKFTEIKKFFTTISGKCAEGQARYSEHSA